MPLLKLPLPKVPLPVPPLGEVAARLVSEPALAASRLVTHPGRVVSMAGRGVSNVARAVGEPARAVTQLVTRPERTLDVLVRHHERRVVTTEVRSHLELRRVVGRTDVDDEALARAVEEAVAAQPGVRWAEVHGPSRRLVVEHDARTTPAELAAVVDAAEARLGLQGCPFPEDRDHPADEAPILRDLMGITADMIGVALGTSLQALRFRPVPFEIDLAAALNVADQVVPVRRAIERRLGAPLTELTVGFANAIVQGVVQGPIGPMVDLGHRVMLLRELTTRRATWLAREPELFSAPSGLGPIAVRTARVVPVPDGPIEVFERTAWYASLGAGGATLLLSRRLERAAAMVQAGMPKAARLGREGFVTELARHLASRGVLVQQPAALRLLDRVDCLAITADLLGPRGVDLAALVTAAGRGDVRVMVEVPPGAHVPTGVEGVAPGELVDAVLAAQREGHVVALATGHPDGAALVADLVLGLTGPGPHVPWPAHLLGTDDPADVLLLLEAALQARAATRESVRIATVGAGLGALVALGSFAPRRNRPTPSPVAVAAALSLVNGVRHSFDLARRPLPVRVDPTPWHALDIETVLDRLGSGPDGLDPSAAAARQRPEPRPPRLPVAFVRAVGDELVNPLTPILAAGAVMSVLVGSVTDAALVTGVVLANGVVGGVQNLRAERALQALSRTHRADVRTCRAGVWTPVPAASLVQGDLVELQAGHAVPADCRIVWSASLEADESALTGESLPVPKAADPTDAPVIAERTSMLYEGSWVAAGEARAVVVATGHDTEARRAVLLAGEPPASGVEARLSSWTSRMIPVSLGGGALVVANGLLRGLPLRETLGAGVSLAVAAVPEGLPLLSTVAQLSAARRLSKHQVLVRNARAIEALGRVDVLCADKTGTLTEGRITLRLVSDGVDEAPADALTPHLDEVLRVAVRATPVADDPAELAHPTDRAVAEGGRANGTDVEEWTPEDVLAFEPARGFHAAIGTSGTTRVLAVKGAPEAVLPRCHAWRRAGVEQHLSDDDRARIDEHVRSLARRGLRVLAVAEAEVGDGTALEDEAVTDLVFRGLVGLADPPRPTATEAVRLLRDAGVRVLMITGDHPSTAEAIGVELGVLDGTEVVTGQQIDDMDDEQLATLLQTASVFARVTPVHKVRIVKALQRNGHTVAMTGDGANDAPAIRLADVGIALGPRSTAAARSAADLVVLDDRIETIVDAMVEGRALWGSVRDAVSVLVGGNLGEILFTVGGSLVVGTPPMNARQLLLVNLLTDAAPALAIAARPPRATSVEELLREGPDTSLGAELDRAIAWRAGATAAATMAGWAVARLSGPPARASTVALATTVGTQLGQTLLTATRDPFVLAAGLGSAGLLVAIVQTPGLSQLFGCTPLDPGGWMIATTAATAGSFGALLLPRLVGQRSVGGAAAPT
jgi:cation-transporting ATPase I